jgi:hypothetical protein
MEEVATEDQVESRFSKRKRLGISAHEPTRDVLPVRKHQLLLE